MESELNGKFKRLQSIILHFGQDFQFMPVSVLERKLLSCPSILVRDSNVWEWALHMAVFCLCFQLIRTFVGDSTENFPGAQVLCSYFAKDNCVQLAEMFEKNSSMCVDKCIRITVFRGGRWGNQLTQLLRAVQLAEYFGIRTVIVSPGHAGLKEDMKYRSVRIAIDRGQNMTCLEGFFFYEGAKSIKEVQHMSFLISHRFRAAYSEILGVKPLGDDVLVMHIRSGDIIAKKVASSYAQPPCQYYFDVIGSRNWSEVRVISEDYRNPCVRILRESSIPVYIRRSFDVDLREMFGARNLVVGRGTIGFLIAVMSVNLNRLYTFNASTTRFLLMTNASEHYNCVPSDLYFNTVVKKWRCSQEQLDLMRTDKCRLWQDMRNFSLIDDDVYVHEHIL